MHSVQGRRRLRLVQAGLGQWGTSWARDVLPQVPALEPVAYVDRSEEALGWAQRELGVEPARCFTDLGDALHRVDADLVLVTVGVDRHFDLAYEALTAGKHVLVEKPFTASLAQAEELVELARALDLRCIVSQNYRFQPAPVLAAQLVADGRIGRVHQVAIDFRRHAVQEGFARDWRRMQPLLHDMAIHHFDLLRMVLATEATRVSCRSWNPPQSPYVEPAAALATVELSNGALVSWRGSFISEGEPTPWAGCWRIEGDKGEVCFSSRDHLAGHEAPDRLSLRKGGREVRAPALPKLPQLDRAGVLAAAAAAIASGTPNALLSEAEDNTRSLALAHAAVASAAGAGDWVEIPAADDKTERHPVR